jgi:putative peptide zinc metalloprotease protein
VRAGAALKRLPASEGPLRWVVLAPGGTEVARLGDAEAGLLMLLDGESGLADLVTAAEARFGAAGTARLARLLGELADRGFLEGVDAAPDAADGRLARLVRPRQWVVHGLGPRITRAYRAGGWVLFTRPVQVATVLVAVLGLLAYADLLAQRGGTPFVVADRVGLGGLVFMLGRFLVAAVHETAHALTMAAFGRSVDRAGLKTVIGIPFVFVDTTEAWFEPRRRRIAVSAAGPVSDFALGGLFGLTAWLLPAGNTRDIMFQLTLAAYVGALFNLNPFLDRDGYHILVDRLGEPGLRRRARTWLAARLSGREVEGPASRALVVYAVLSVGWLVVSALFVVLLSTLYYGQLTAIAPEEVVWAVLVAFYLLLFLPVAMVVGRPLLQRRRAPRVEAAGEPTV